MNAGPGGKPQAADDGWTIQRAEELLRSLKGVVSVRVVARPGGNVDEVHLLTTEELSPKQTVRNVESALLAHFDLSVDHRKISVAQAGEAGENREAFAEPAVLPHPGPVIAEVRADTRLLFVGHQVESERSHRVRMKVTVEWEGKAFSGEAAAADLPRARLEAIAKATLRAIEGAMTEVLSGETEVAITMALDGVKVVSAFDRSYVLVAVHAIHGREITALSGAAPVDDTTDRAVILATLQTTDRWVRGRM